MPRTLLVLLLVLAVVAAPARSAAKTLAVLLYDGSQPDQAALAAAAKEAVAPHAAAVELRTVNVSAAASAPFLDRHNLTRRNAPALLILEGAKGSVARRLPLSTEVDPNQSVREILAALKLPIPEARRPAPGPVLAFAAGSDAEKRYLLAKVAARPFGSDQWELDTTGLLTYRFVLPEGLRTADLEATLAGDFIVESADNRAGPWSPLIDSRALFGGAAPRIPGPVHAVVDLTSILTHLPGALYLRVRTTGQGRGALRFGGLRVIARVPRSPSGQETWMAEVARLRERYLPAALAHDLGTPLSGTISRNTTLKADDSPYALKGELTVLPRATLTVEPGVTIRAAGEFRIVVQGRLIARGTAAAPILFVSAAPFQPDDWRGIDLRAGAVGAAAKEENVLAYCRVANCAGVTLDHASAEISHCVFRDDAAGVRAREGAAPRLDHDRFESCRDGLVVAGGGVSVTGSEWVGCNVALSVLAVDPKQPLRFERNSIRDSRYFAVSVSASGKQEPLRLAGNHWSGTAPERMLSGAAVTFDPRLPSPPAGVGAGW